jgi:hypothetical protein
VVLIKLTTARPFSGFAERSHIRTCVWNAECIKGVFRVRDGLIAAVPPAQKFFRRKAKPVQQDELWIRTFSWQQRLYGTTRVAMTVSEMKRRLLCLGAGLLLFKG